MNLKLFFGVLIPTVVIVLLTVLSSLDVGFTATTQFEKKLTLNDIFTNSTLRNQIEIGSVELSNEYFLPKRYELPVTFACLVDEDGTNQAYDVGYLSYSEGDLAYGQDSYFDTYYYYSRDKVTSVEVSSNDKKSVKIYLYPENLQAYDYYSNKTQQELILEKYGQYDSLALVENSKVQNNYRRCYSLSKNELDSARKISLK